MPSFRRTIVFLLAMLLLSTVISLVLASKATPLTAFRSRRLVILALPKKPGSP